eukprot:2037852-Prymnesium_polylepis.1
MIRVDDNPCVTTVLRALVQAVESLKQGTRQREHEARGSHSPCEWRAMVWVRAMIRVRLRAPWCLPAGRR